MDLRQLGYVVAVVDHGGFTRAAEAMHVAQPSLSQAVRTLEAELGVELFHRTSRPVRLTAAGEALLEPARQALRDVATARAAITEVMGLEAGHLDLVSIPTLAVHPAAQLIGRFRTAHPGISVRLAEPEDADAVALRVRTGTSEIGLAELPLAGTDLVSHSLGSQEYVALIPTELADQLAGADAHHARDPGPSADDHLTGGHVDSPAARREPCRGGPHGDGCGRDRPSRGDRPARHGRCWCCDRAS